MWVWSLGQEDPLKEEMATHSSILAWKIPMDIEPWQTAVHEVAKSQAQLNMWHTINGMKSYKITPDYTNQTNWSSHTHLLSTYCHHHSARWCKRHLFLQSGNLQWSWIQIIFNVGNSVGQNITSSQGIGALSVQVGKEAKCEGSCKRFLWITSHFSIGSKSVNDPT